MSTNDSKTHKHLIYNPESAFDCLLERLFDYAGMFPPAQRDFETALRESAHLSSTLRRPWLVASDIVLDTAHVAKLPSINLKDFGFTSSLSICALATEPCEQVSSALQSLSTGSLLIRVSSIEAKVTDDSTVKNIAQWSVLSSQFGALLAIEPDLSRSNWREQLGSCVSALSASSAKVALKCRLTGPTGIGAERLAAAISSTCEFGIAFKVTGGLHHPIVDSTRHQYPMGFLNVAAAVMLKRSLKNSLSETALIDILTNTSRSAFSWKGGLRFGDYSISLEQLSAAKALAPFSIGSCSIHEPDEDLILFSEP